KINIVQPWLTSGWVIPASARGPFAAPGGNLPYASWKLCRARPSCLRWLAHFMRAAASLTFWTAASSRPMRIAMMAITTSSSISVNPDRVVEWRGRNMGIPHFHRRAGDVSPLFGGDRLLVRLLVQTGQVPDFHVPVATGRGAVLPVRAERHPGDEAA